MSECYIQDVDEDAIVKCDDCGWQGRARYTDPIRDVEQRLTAGGIVPAGECPECGALAYLIEPEAAWSPVLIDPQDELDKAMSELRRALAVNILQRSDQAIADAANAACDAHEALAMASGRHPATAGRED